MINQYTCFLIIILLTYGCSGSREKREVPFLDVCCIDSLEYDFIEDLLVPASIKIKLSNCDTLNIGSIRSVVFPQIVIEERSFYELWASEIEFPNTLTLIVNTNYFEDKGLSKDSVEHILSERIGIVTSRNDTIYVEPCQISK